MIVLQKVEIFPTWDDFGVSCQIEAPSMRMPVMEVNEGGMDDLLLQLSCRRGKVIFQPEKVKKPGT